MNKQMKHIAYYTKKVVQEGEKARPSYKGKRNTYRNNRLLEYKRMLNEMVKTSLPVWIYLLEVLWNSYIFIALEMGYNGDVNVL